MTVYERERNQCLIGILVSGADDTGVRLNASWERHEHVLPLRCRPSRAARNDIAGAPGVDDGRLFEETDAGLLGLRRPAAST